MRGRIALQSTSCEILDGTFPFATTFGVCTRPRVVFLELVYG